MYSALMWQLNADYSCKKKRGGEVFSLCTSPCLLILRFTRFNISVALRRFARRVLKLHRSVAFKTHSIRITSGLFLFPVMVIDPCKKPPHIHTHTHNFHPSGLCFRLGRNVFLCFSWQKVSCQLILG